MAQALYTPAILAAATGLAAYPWDEALPLRGEARSRSCGSSIVMGLASDESGHIARIGLKPHACAVGQAAAHVFASAAIGRGRDEIATTRAALSAWLAGDAPLPDWPGVDLLAPARAYPGRHAAILLAWDAALVALS